MNEPLTAQLPGTDATWREIESLLEEISELAQAEISIRDFYGSLLDRTVRVLAALGGAVWIRDPKRGVHLEHQIPDSPTAAAVDGCDQRTRMGLIESVVLAQKARVLAPRADRVPRSDQGSELEAVSPSDSLMLLCPVLVERDVEAVVEIFQRPGASPAVEQGYVRLLVAICGMAADFHRRRQLAILRLWKEGEERAQRFAERVHQRLELDATSYALANEGRVLLGCDRLSVLTLHGRRCRVRAISGVDSIDRRATLVRRLEHLVDVALATGERVSSDSPTDDLPLPLETALAQFVDESHSRSVNVLPLQAAQADEARLPAAMLGALVLERFAAAPLDASAGERAAFVQRHATLALRNALQYQNLPLLPIWQYLAGLRWLVRVRRWPWTVSVFVAILACVMGLSVIPAEFKIEARGQLQPRVRRNVFAPDDSVVQQVHVQHADRVAAGELLVELRKSDLDFEFARVLGEMQTARKQLDSVQAAKLQAERSRASTREESEQLAAKEEELKKLLEGLARQHSILRAQQAELRVVSPIAGQVLTWDVAQLLAARPVQRGQSLMTVVDAQGPWILELRVPDHDAGYVLAAQASTTPRLAVSFILATDPSSIHRGHVERVALATEVDDDAQATVRVSAQVDGKRIERLRPGAAVVAQLHCGRRSLGYVWFHDLIEVVRTNLLF